MKSFRGSEFSINRPAQHWIALIIAVENGQL